MRTPLDHTLPTNHSLVRIIQSGLSRARVINRGPEKVTDAKRSKQTDLVERTRDPVVSREELTAA